jgi:hypothetical protein
MVFFGQTRRFFFAGSKNNKHGEGAENEESEFHVKAQCWKRSDFHGSSIVAAILNLIETHYFS